MFNWLFGKKKETTTENVVLEVEVLDDPVIEENPKMDKLFESFPELKRLCDMQFENDQNAYKNPVYVSSYRSEPKFSEVKYYRELKVLPEVSKVMSNGCLHKGGVYIRI